MFDSLMSWLKGVVESSLQWLLDALLWLPKKLWQDLLDGLAVLIEAIPVPDFLANAGSFLGGLPTGVVYFFHFFAVPEGIAMICSALLLRFVLRRIPFIG
ncbi:hypothetical protein D3C78_904970 [compost metagenome]